MTELPLTQHSQHFEMRGSNRLAVASAGKCPCLVLLCARACRQPQSSLTGGSHAELCGCCSSTQGRALPQQAALTCYGWLLVSITSSMKTMEGERSRARENRLDTSFSLSPSHLDTRSEEDTLKKVLSASVATACTATTSWTQHQCWQPGWSGVFCHGLLKKHHCRPWQQDAASPPCPAGRCSMASNPLWL